MIRYVLFVPAFCSLLAAASAQEPTPVSVGAGSYASHPPKGKMVDGKRKVDLVEETENRRLYLLKDEGRPIPSNKWYQNLLFQQYGTGLWAMPHKVDATPEGIELFHPTKFDGGGTKMITDFPLVLGGKDFKPTDSRAKSWTDWTVSFRMPQDEARFMDVTLGQGMPYVWAEFKGVQPRIAFGGAQGKGSRGKNPATFFDAAGKTAALPLVGDAVGVLYEGRAYGVFAPQGTTFSGDGRGVDVAFAGASAFLVLAPLPSPERFALFHKHAYAVPRDSKLQWNYDRNASTLSTTWKLTTEPLQGTEKRTLQGWLPHHWRENAAPMEFTGVDYTTIRGKLRCVVGEEFTVRYPFHGVLPNLPAPQAEGGIDRKRTESYLREHFADSKKGFARDTYWGGKDLERFAQAAFVASQTKDDSFESIVEKLRAELEDWFTYLPGEKDRYFAYYPKRKGLVGFNASFGSQHFTDHHFHNGYFVFTSGLLCQMQPEFATRYGEMAKLVAKTYANYDRDDRRFPFFRTFDLWRGHSFADGNGFPDGNNQESTGEAVNSWTGMILLGEALGDEALTAAGVMGYSFETRANVEYWFDPHGDVFPESYPHEACGMVWCNGNTWGTWFSGSPGWIYGIQWIPSGPYFAFYDRDPKFIQKTYADLQRESAAFDAKEAAKKPGSAAKPGGLKSLGGELASYHLGFLMHADAKGVVEQIDKLHAEPGDRVAHDPWMENLYYQARSLAELGRVDWSCRSDSPTAMVYAQESTGKRTFVAWNPTAKPRPVRFTLNGERIGELLVPPHAMVRAASE